jgi:hypothetical protein
MTDAVVSSLPARHSRSRWRLTAFVKDVVFGMVLATNPVTAVFVLGWLVRRMHWIAVAGAPRPGWIMAQDATGLRRWLGGLAANTREGVSAASALALATLPFTALAALAWWAGWNNSFSKGYEDALAGPLLSFAAIALALPIIVLLPMALAHRAVDGRWHSLFNLGAVTARVARASWRYVLLILLWTFFGFAILAFRMVPAFGETIWPALAGLEGQPLQDMRNLLYLLQGATIFISLLILRGLSARLYARANARMAERRPAVLAQFMCWFIMLPAAFVLVAQIYVAQFFNYDTSFWFSHPLLVLPAAN